MNNNLKIKVIMGSTRENRFSDKPALWIFNFLKEIKEIEAELLDLRDYPMPFFNSKLTPKQIKDGNYGNEMVNTWSDKIKEADAFIIVTPEYNHGYPAVLKNALDWLFYEWNNKPVGFVSYGTQAGARSVEQLRQVAIELQMLPIRNAVHIPSHWTLLDENGNLKDMAFKPFEKARSELVSQLVLLSNIIKKSENF